MDPRFSDPWVCGQLVNAGIVERLVRPGKPQGVTLSEDVRFSLMLDEDSAGSACRRGRLGHDSP